MTEFPASIGYEQALAIVRQVGYARALGPERLAIRRLDGRVLAQELVAPMDLPAFDNSRMDGFALRHADLAAEAETGLRLNGEQFAGMPVERTLGEGECMRITTGAPIPAGADTVVIKERVREHEGVVFVPAGVRQGADIRAAGEDVRRGDALLARGQVLSPARVSLAAALGIADLVVARRPTVAVFTTGDELVEPGLPLMPGQIYNSNRELLMGLLRAEGLEPVAWPTLPDDPARIEAALTDAATAFDLILSVGGVSAGEKDYLPALLQAQGKLHFWKVRMKPGMPVIFGDLDQALVLGLPGNPVSVLATFQALARPLIDALQGRTEVRPRRYARLAAPWNKAHARLEFLRGRLIHEADGSTWVQPNAADASHRLRAAADSDALIVLAEGERQWERGEAVEILPY